LEELWYKKGKGQGPRDWTNLMQHCDIKILNHLTPNGHYMGRTAQLTSCRCTLYIYSTNTRIEYFKHAGIISVFSSSKCRLFHNATFFGSRITQF